MSTFVFGCAAVEDIHTCKTRNFCNEPLYLYFYIYVCVFVEGMYTSKTWNCVNEPFFFLCCF